MGDGIDAGVSQDWRIPGKYASTLGLDHRALAWRCLCRDRDFLSAAASVAPTSIYIVKDDPPIMVVTLSEEDRLASWGVHFRAVAGKFRGDGLCRLASR